jgi:type I restriction enzyme S subunit
MVTESIPQGYKQTEVGVIPEDWDVDKIKNHAQITTGAKNTQDRLEDGKYPFFVRSQKVERINSYSFEGEAVLTAGDGVGTGKIFHYINGRFDFHQRVYKISNFDSKLDGRYFYLQFSNKFYDRIMSMTAKSSVDSVRMEMIAEMNIPLPDIKEQQAIAQALSETNELIEHLDKLIKKKKNIKKGAMQELLTGKKRLPGFEGEWELKELGTIANFEHGRGLSKSDLKEDGKKCIHYGQLFTEYKELINHIKSRTNVDGNMILSKANDVLMPTSDVTPRGLATASCIKENGVILGGGILIIRLHECYEGTFLSYFITQNKEKILKLTKGSTVFHIYASDLSKLEIKFPNYKEQQAIVQVLSEMDEEIDELESELKKYKMIKEGMMQKLLTGEVRLTWK